MSIEFPLLRKPTPFGWISDPKIPVTVGTLAGSVSYGFLIDTGADFSVAPRRLAQQIGLDWDVLPEARVVGVEQGGVRARLGRLPIRIGTIDLSIRRLFVAVPRAPFVLGRADFLDRFVLTIDQPMGKLALTDIAEPAQP